MKGFIEEFKNFAIKGNMVDMAIGIIIGAFGYAVFQVPHNISAGGIGSIALMVNHFTGHDVGLLFWLLNIPMIMLGFFYACFLETTFILKYNALIYRYFIENFKFILFLLN